MTHLFIGHSLGAARANANGARAIAAGAPPAGFFKFGEPSTGWGKFNDLLRQVPENCSPSYRNETATGHDLVTDVLKYLPGFPYNPPWSRTLVSEEPPPFNGVDLFRYHHAYLYRDALLRQNPTIRIAGVSPVEAINWVIALYDDPASVAWDHFDDGSDDGIVWAMKIHDQGSKCFIYRGSKTPQDFTRDGEFPWWVDRDIGPVEIGFQLGSHSTWEEARALLAA